MEASVPEAIDRVDRAIDRLHLTIGDIRTFIVGLGPEAGAGLGLTLETLAREIFAGSATQLSIDLSGAATLDARLTPEASHELVQVAREALSNVARHSGAGRAKLALLVEGNTAELRVEDNGAGFDPGQRFGTGHFGLANLRGRAAAVGGTLTIESRAGEGTRIIVRLPIAPMEPIA